MAKYTDPDFSDVDSLPDPSTSPKLSTELEGLAGAIKDTAGGVAATTAGNTPEAVQGALAEVQQATRDAATNAAVAEAAIKILKDAKATWDKNAPKATDLQTADDAQDTACKALAAAQKAEDDAREAYAALQQESNVTDNMRIAAKKKLNDAVADTKAKKKDFDAKWKAFLDLKQKRKDADDAYEAQRKLAAEKIKDLKGSKTADVGGDGTTGVPLPGQSTGSGNGSGSGTGAPAAPHSGTPAAKAPGTAAPTPAGKTPGTAAPSAGTPDTKTSGSGIDPSTLALASLLSQGQGQQQQPQQQQAATPTAAQQQPQQATQPQQNQPGKGDGKNEKKDGAIDVDDLIRSGALPATATASVLGLGGGGSSSSVDAPVAAAPAAGPSTVLRPAGTPITGTGIGGAPAVNTQVPPTSGTSQTGLHTSSDVSGRSTPTATAFSPTPAGAETKTSAAGAGGAGGGQSAAAQQAAGKPAMPQMPMVPHMGGVGGGAGGGHGKDGDGKKIETYRSEGYHGEDTVREAVRGGTIAQNRPTAA
ncbi:hypothetical protein [Mycobacterium sp. 155]|uniref:hypothetical protein n=1 Tax=Mycobacterium sp. 155 TaxID=1157943 RepID=UPI0012FA5479|nr:hypothetical protein [Mycobacterium sp. 155]